MTPEQQRAIALANARRRQAEATGSAAPGQPAAPTQPAEAKPNDSGFNQGLDYVDNTATTFLDGMRNGAAALAGAPVDLVNAIPMLANFIPGVDGVGPISPKPFGGRETFESILGLGGLIPEGPAPQDALQRVVNRAGFEVGASAVPAVGVLGKAASMPARAVREIAARPTTLGQSIAGMMLEPAKVAPGAFAGREASSALAAGLGAGAANELTGNAQFGDNFWSDFAGSIGGVGALGVGSAVIGAGRNVAAGALAKPSFMDDVAGQEVADRLINNSSAMQQQAAQADGSLDTQQIVDALRRPALIEEAIPGYRANIGDRTLDPGLQTFAFNQDAVSPGAASARRTGNEAVVNDKLMAMEPGGDPARLRAGLETARDARLAEAARSTQTAQDAVDTASQSLRSVMPADARGSEIRAALEGASDQARNLVRQAWEPLNASGQQVDMAPIAERFGSIRDELSVAEQNRFLPAEAGIPDKLVSPAEASADTGLLDARGNPIMRPGAEADGMQPINEVLGLRSALTDAARAAARDGQDARIINEHISALDEALEAAVPTNLREQYNAARAMRRDYGDRFQRPQTAIAQTLDRQQGQYRTDNSAVPGKFVQDDQGRIADFEALMREAGSDNRVQTAVRDQILSDVQSRGLLENPDRLDDYLGQYGKVFERFPQLRQDLGNAGSLQRKLAEAQTVERSTTRDLTTPGRSATASYLKYGDEAVGDAIRSVTTSARPREAVKELLQTANAPKARQDLRSALWTEVSRRGREQAPGVTGEQRWNGKRLRDMFSDPKVSVVADELWSDAPEDLANIRKVFGALATAEGSTRARAPGSSGTAQSLSGKFDPALSSASIASRARSVKRGVLSPSVAIIDVAGTWLRGRTAQAQSRAIDTLASAVVNNPGLAADLLEKYNPATAAARRRMLTQKYGVRATQVLNLLDEIEEDDDPVKDAVRAR